MRRDHSLDFRKSDRVDAALKTMYPDENLQDSYVLFVKSDLWFPYQANEIKATIEFVFDDEIVKRKYRVRKPYPNKSIRQIAMVNGRKVCHLGVPITFSSFEELKSLKCIYVCWVIDAPYVDGKNGRNILHIVYDVDFQYEEGKRIYHLYTYDTTLTTTNDYPESVMINYRDEYSNILRIERVEETASEIATAMDDKQDKEFDKDIVTEVLQEMLNDDRFDLMSYKITPVKDNIDLMDQEDYRDYYRELSTNILENLEPYLNDLNPDDILDINAYYSEEVLAPDDVTLKGKEPETEKVGE